MTPEHRAAPFPTDPGSYRPAARRVLRLARAFARLPLGGARAIGGLVGVLAVVLSPSYRRRIRTHLELAGLSGARLYWRSAVQAGQMVAELPFIWMRPLETVIARVRCDEQAVLEAAEREGRGILFLTAHLGAFEVSARYYAARAPITVMFRPPRKASLSMLLAEARNLGRMRAVPAALSGVRAMIRSLRAGEAVGLLPDQVPMQGEGRWAPFFGREAYTMTLPQRLAQASDAAVILAVAQRVPAGWHLRLRRLVGPVSPEYLNAHLEDLIRGCPEQYLWGYNRYKQPGRAAVGSPVHAAPSQPANRGLE